MGPGVALASLYARTVYIRQRVDMLRERPEQQPQALAIEYADVVITRFRVGCLFKRFKSWKLAMEQELFLEGLNGVGVMRIA